MFWYFCVKETRRINRQTTVKDLQVPNTAEMTLWSVICVCCLLRPITYTRDMARKRLLPSVEVFLMELNPYLCAEIWGTKKATENSSWLGRRMRFVPRPSIYQLWEQNLSAMMDHLWFVIIHYCDHDIWDM